MIIYSSLLTAPVMGGHRALWSQCWHLSFWGVAVHRLRGPACTRTSWGPLSSRRQAVTGLLSTGFCTIQLVFVPQYIHTVSMQSQHYILTFSAF